MRILLIAPHDRSDAAIAGRSALASFCRACGHTAVTCSLAVEALNHLTAPIHLEAALGRVASRLSETHDEPSAAMAVSKDGDESSSNRDDLAEVMTALVRSARMQLLVRARQHRPTQQRRKNIQPQERASAWGACYDPR